MGNSMERILAIPIIGPSFRLHIACLFKEAQTEIPASTSHYETDWAAG
jgi:hypothetical protein